MIQEKDAKPIGGALPVIFIWVVLVLGGLVFCIVGVANQWPPGWFGILMLLVGLYCSRGGLVLAPNQACALVLFETYKGSVKQAGFYYVNPFNSRKKISLRARSF